MTHFTRVNPFFRADVTDSSRSSAAPPKPIYVKLPTAPRTGSPVPHLTSLYHFNKAGEYGSRDYPELRRQSHKDLLLFFEPTTVFDPMTGSGTCRDVCMELAILCVSTDLKSGFDASDPDVYSDLRARPGFDFIWAHPPYWRQKIYSDNPRDMSSCATLDDFLTSYGIFIRQCAHLLLPHGQFAILMGDYSDRRAGFIPLTYHTKQIAFAAGLQQASTDIIRFSHGASSSKKSYRSSFIPGLHDVCMVFEKPGPR